MSMILMRAILQQQANNQGGLGKSLIKYGRLYTWAAATGGTLITGMTTPTNAQWTTLVNYINSEYNVSPNNFGVGNHLKHPRKDGTPVLSSEYNTSTHPRWEDDATHYGRDTVGFAALPGGYRLPGGNFEDIGYSGRWWSATEFDSNTAWRRSMPYNVGDVHNGNNDKISGFSLRCFRAATSGEQSSYNDGDVIEQVKDYDNNIYDCIRIGTQVWTKQNIATTKYTDGTSILKVIENVDWKDLADTTKAYCDYNNDDSNTFFLNENDSIW